VNLDLPPCPTDAVDIAPVRARDWALSDEELRDWWAGVQRLRPLKQDVLASDAADRRPAR
jgi:hypothetical protein